MKRPFGLSPLVLWPSALILLLLALAASDPFGAASRFREAVFDRVLSAWPRESADDGVMLVDIDRRSLAEAGSWPWPRDVQARLVKAIMAAEPAVLAIDIAYLDADGTSPAALARRLGAQTGRQDIAALGRELADGDLELAEAIGAGNVALGLLLETDGTGQDMPPLTLAIEGGQPDIAPWQLASVIGPKDPLFSAATGFGVISLPVEQNGLVRFAPLLAATADNVFAGLSVEALRLAEGVSAPILNSPSRLLSLGSYSIPLGARAELRLHPAGQAHWAARRIAASDLLDPARASAAAEKLKGRVVFLGGSAPELSAFRATAADPATPSMLIHADAAEQIRAGHFPRRGEGSISAELGLGAVLGVFAVLLTARFGPVVGLSGLALAAAVLALGAWMAFARWTLLFDLATPVAIAGTGYVAAAIGGFVSSRAGERRMRQRFAQRLAPAVVDRIVADPALLKLDGSHREITVLFTDIEDFTALTERTEPKQLIAVLDRYLEAVTRAVVAHGGMVDKIVGDSVHAIFNAPIDLAGHPGKAVACAAAILQAAKAIENMSEIQAIGLGRTRIGIETGRAVVGDVGGMGRLDYTAHGDVINMAARLEAMNKQLGTSVLVGPGLLAALPDLLVRDLGEVELRGLSRKVRIAEPLFS